MDTGGLGSQGKGSGVPEVRLSEEGCEEDQARMAKLGSEVVLSKKKKKKKWFCRVSFCLILGKGGLLPPLHRGFPEVLWDGHGTQSVQ